MAQSRIRPNLLGNGTGVAVLRRLLRPLLWRRTKGLFDFPVLNLACFVFFILYYLCRRHRYVA
jgi:hypothetical protein